MVREHLDAEPCEELACQMSRGGLVEPPKSEIVECDARAVQQAREVVVRREEQLCRVGERPAAREHLRAHVSIGGDDGRVGHGSVELVCQPAYCGIDPKHPIWIWAAAFISWTARWLRLGW